MSDCDYKDHDDDAGWAEDLAELPGVVVLAPLQ